MRFLPGDEGAGGDCAPASPGRRDRAAPQLHPVRGHLQLRINDNWIEGAAVHFRGSYPVLDARLVRDRVIVLYDYMAFERGHPARNLFCYDRLGQILWRAPGIGMGATDAYTAITSEEPPYVGNFAGVSCRVDEQTGEVLSTCFTK